jgi:hypothetical protein
LELVCLANLKAPTPLIFPGLPAITETENADAFKKEEDEGAGFKR